MAAIERLLSVPGTPQAAQPGVDYTRSIEEALHRAEEAVEREPENPDLRLTLAERRVEAKQDAQGLRDFQSILEKNPKSTRALVGLATAYLDLGRKDKALSALRQASALDPGNWIIHKQIWAIEHPEQFYPAINGQWQKEQLQQEKGQR
ncbi:MAG: tetratricopeptide repeat protein [Terriglobia bacterium]